MIHMYKRNYTYVHTYVHAYILIYTAIEISMYIATYKILKLRTYVDKDSSLTFCFYYRMYY